MTESKMRWLTSKMWRTNERWDDLIIDDMIRIKDEMTESNMRWLNKRENDRIKDEMNESKMRWII